MQKRIIVTPSDHLKRIDFFVSKIMNMSRSQIQRLLKIGAIIVDHKRVAQSYKVRKGEVITINIPDEEKDDILVPEPIALKIIYKDEHIIVVDKPPNMVVYPAPGHKRGTLMNAIAYYSEKLASIGRPLRPGVVHRLDKDTSGVMVVALDDQSYYSLVEQFKERSINRKYIALVYGELREDSGQIRMKIGRAVSDRKKMSVRTKKGKEAVTRWRVLKRFRTATLIEATLGTGRTHQIRVHFSAIGHPVIGDRTYGKKNEIEINIDGKKKKIFFHRQMLHAETLGFIHPVTGEYMEFSSPMPPDMEQYIKELSSK
jgi:23S rRNA pseudouridine1911/1915/1917 synthase